MSKSFDTPTHPLDPLTKSELLKAVEIVKGCWNEGGLFPVEDASNVRFETIELYEPSKEFVRSFQPGNNDDIGDRLARASAFLMGGGIGVYRFVVNLTQSTVVSSEFLPKARPMIQLDEFVAIENAVKSDPTVIAACQKRGITNMDWVCVGTW